VSSDIWVGPIRDEPAKLDVRSSVIKYRGPIWNVRKDEIVIGDQLVERDVITHPGAVAVAALDEQERILLIRQYRHPRAAYLFELPAGLRDVDGEDPVTTAQRELAEETGYEAADWSFLVEEYNSPGGSAESLIVYLARGVRALPGGRVMTDAAEEQDMPHVWVPLADAVRYVLAGDIKGGTVVVGVLAAAALSGQGFAT
jgi:8-oxo-dGDP phosphatase